MRYGTKIILCITILLISGCSLMPKSVIYVNDSERVTYLRAGETITTTQDSVVISEGKYHYYLRCEDFALQKGMMP